MIFRTLCLVAGLSLPAAAIAHDSYIQLRFGSWTLVNAHGAEEDDSYSAEKVANVAAHGADGASVAIETVDKGDYTAFAPAEGTTAIAATYVSGFWTKDKDGKWHNMPKSEVANPDRSGEYQRHAVAVIGDGDVFTPFGLPLEIVPSANPLHMEPGDMLTVTVLFNGEPLAGAKISDALPGGIKPVTTGADGTARVEIMDGHNTLVVGHKVDHPAPAKADSASHKAALSFVPHGHHDH